MKATMDMSSYEMEYDSADSGYGDEILFAGWNPEISTVCEQLQFVPTTEQSAMADAPTMEVAELFMRKMYSYQH